MQDRDPPPQKMKTPAYTKKQPEQCKNGVDDLQLMVWTLQRIPSIERARRAFELAIQSMDGYETEEQKRERNSPSST